MSSTVQLPNFERQSVASGLKSFQLDSGLVLQTHDGVGDPWNHVEVLMALASLGEIEAAQKGFYWLRDHQLVDGSWFQYYRREGVHSARIDFNVISYVATGLLHYYRVTGDETFTRLMWPTVERATSLAYSNIDSQGFVPWSIDGRGRRATFALLTGSASLHHSLSCAQELANLLGVQLDWSQDRIDLLGHRVAKHPQLFADKSTFAMDSYYPILAGVRRFFDGERERFERRFLIEGLGVRCVATTDWVTTAESAEYALTLIRSGFASEALKILESIEELSTGQGFYFTGVGHPSGVTFPLEEVSSYSAAALVLAWDALERTDGEGSVFLGEPTGNDSTSCPAC